MKESFLLTIIIPTKNRQEYVLKAVEQILSIDDERIQVVVQDNSLDSCLEVMLEQYNEDNRLKYNYSSQILSFVDNFNIAVSLADGDYVCIIGDDDGINPQIIEVTQWAKDNNIDVINPELGAVYFWPKSNALKDEIDTGKLNIYKISNEAKLVKPLIELKKLLLQGGQNYLSLDLAKLYHGVVKKECLEKIKIKTGRYFGGLSPDIYITVALSLTVEKVLRVNFPLTISGICSTSGSADSANGKHTGNLEDAPHFKGHLQYNWATYVPKFYSVETIWADSAIAALNDFKNKEMINEFNIHYLSKKCLKKYPQFKEIIINNCNEWIIQNNERRMNLEIINLKNDFKYTIKRVIRRVKRKNGDVISIENVNNIIDAGNILKERLCELKITKEEIIKSLDNLIN